MSAQVAIAGAVTIEDEVTLWGQVGVNKTLRIGKGATVLAQSGVPGDLAGNQIYFGTPTETAMEKKRERIWIKRIPEIWEKNQRDSAIVRTIPRTGLFNSFGERSILKRRKNRK